MVIAPAEDGTAEGVGHLRDAWKKRAKLTVYPCLGRDGPLWIGLG